MSTPRSRGAAAGQGVAVRRRRGHRAAFAAAAMRVALAAALAFVSFPAGTLEAMPLERQAPAPRAEPDTAVAVAPVFMDVAEPAAGRSGPVIARQAVVLGGGGARGLAHAGALLGLERRGYQPDLVVGTSMGAIVGGLYAAGYEPERLWELIEDTDWPALFTPHPRLIGVEPVGRFPMLELDALAPGAGRVPGLIADWRINRMLVQLLFDAGVRASDDFDRLPRRFRAVAADLATGEVAVLARGDLARAVRASMAVPAVFSPVLWDGRVLVDGGIAEYLPVGAARDEGAEWVTAVDVIRPSPWLDEADPVAIAMRAFRLILLNTLPDNATADLLIVPAVDASVAEAVFPAETEPLLRAGLEAALAAPKAPRPPDGPAPPDRPAPPGPPPARIDTITVEADDAALAALVRNAFAGVAPGPYDAHTILAVLDRLYATGLFDGLWPRIRRGADTVGGAAAAARVGAGADTAARGAPPAESGVVLHVIAEGVAPGLLAGAAGYDNDRGARIWIAGVTRPARGLWTAELAAASDGIERWVTASVARPSLRQPPLRWTAGAHLRETRIRIFDDRRIDDGFRIQRTGGWLGVELPRVAPARLVTVRLLAEQVDREGGDARLAVGPAVRFETPPPAVAVVGAGAGIDADARFGELSYRRARARATVDGAAGRWLWAAVASAAAVGGDAPADALPALGDPDAVPGLRRGEERSRTRVVAGFDVAYPVPLEAFARLRVRSGAGAGRRSGVAGPGRWITGAELAAAWATPLGSASAGVAFSTRGHRRLVFDIGGVF